MQRLVAVGLGRADVVIELATDWLPQAMDSTQDLIAQVKLQIIPLFPRPGVLRLFSARFGVSRFDDDSQGMDVIDLTEIQLLAFHFSIKGIDVFWSPGDGRFETHLI